MWVTATAVAIATGAVYVLSPLTVWFAIAMWALHRYATSSLDGDERRWMTALLVTAVVLRVVPIAVLFATTDHAHLPFGVFFGDEEFYVRRAIWLRNVALRIPIHSADLIYAFDDSGWTSQLYVLAFVQALVGPSPYGVHLIGVILYLFAALMLFRLVREPFGSVPAFLLLLLLLFLPSLFAWSISVLKEPLYLLLTACALSLALAVARAQGWWRRLFAAAGLVVIVAAIGTVRDGGAVLVGGGVAVGSVAAWFARRPKALVAVMVATPIVIGVTLNSPRRQIQVYNAVQAAAHQHWGHIRTPGWTYKLLDEHYYEDIASIDSLEARDAALFVVRALERYVTTPWPWEVQSTPALAYIPEQLVWYLLIAMLPFGLVCSLRRDVLLTCLVVGVGAAGALAIAFLSGNVGTLIRLRVLALPYFAVVSLVGLCDLLARRARREDRPFLEKAAPYGIS